ncbi:MAG: DUF6209 family protein [Silvanigrellaceae bacterium]
MDKATAGLLIAAFALIWPTSAAQADIRTDTFKSLDSDSADHSCQVVLRNTVLKREATTGTPVIDIDGTGASWFTFESTVDAALPPLAKGTNVFLLYRASNDPLWHSAPGMTIPGAPQGMQRFSFRLSQSTLPVADLGATRPNPNSKLFVIPYLQTTDGRRIFDHNTSLGDSDSVMLTGEFDWTMNSDPAVCPVAGKGSSTLRFLGNWEIEQRGHPRPGQSLLIEYDLSRLPQCQASSNNGLPAWQTEALIRFLPNGEEFISTLSSMQNGKITGTPARFEIPEGSTDAHVWFRTRGRNCEGAWDSNYGRNYEFHFNPDVAPSPAWAGQWRMLQNAGQCASPAAPVALADDVALTDTDLKNCRVVEAEVLVPGLTTSLETTPEAIQAQVHWSLDGNEQKNQWLTYVGRSGQNYRFRWIVPGEMLRQRAWKKLDYNFQFSTDGLFWLSAGRSTSPHNGIVAPRSFEFISTP